PNYKQAILDAKDNSTTVTGRITGAPVRIIKNKMARQYLKLEKEGGDIMELEKFTLGSLRRAVFDGDTDTGSLMAGQVAGQLKEIKPLERIFADIYNGYLKRLDELNEMR
ncbi:MAG: nitronate monooxygenase, partial [Oscillospiraceae bacterium]